jgi:peptidoglycan/LPS O-acetylase OafA/YrhL
MGAIALLFALGPYIALLFSLWLVGMGCYYFYRTITLTQRQGIMLLTVSLVLLGAAPYLAQFFSEASPFGGGMVGLIQFFLAGIPFAGTIIGFRFAGLSLDVVAPAIRWAAGATFTIYLVHMPLGVLLHAMVPGTWPIGIRWFGIFTVVILVCFALAQFTERRKDAWRRLILRVMQRQRPMAV